MNMRSICPSQPYDVKVDRTTSLGNPFFMSDEGCRDIVCDQYEKWFSASKESSIELSSFLSDIIDIYKKHGKLRLFCWCAPKRCHAETIKRYIEETIKKETDNDVLA